MPKYTNTQFKILVNTEEIQRTLTKMQNKYT